MEMTGVETGREQSTMFTRGEAALSEKRPADAAACFDVVLRADPFNAKAHNGLSRAYWEQGKTEDALNSLTRALELEPNDRETIIHCSRVFSALGKGEDADEVLQSYLERNPDDTAMRSEIRPQDAPARTDDASGIAELFRKQGLIQFEQGRIDRAIICLEMAIENNPALAEAHSDLGVIHHQSGNIEEALQYFYKALELKPEDPEILCNSARVLSQAGHTETAADLYREYLRRCPEDDGAWGEYDGLIRQSTAQQWNSDALSPEVAGIYVETAKKLMGAGDIPGAAEAVERALRIKPESADAMFVLASLHNAIGQQDDAVKMLEQALEIKPSCRDCKALLKSIRHGKGSAA